MGVLERVLEMLLVAMKLKHRSEQHPVGQIKDLDFELELIGKPLESFK